MLPGAGASASSSSAASLAVLSLERSELAALAAPL
jgi:hypothetical protein